MADAPAIRRAAIVRVIVMAVCGAGIAGMIVTSIADSTTGALSFGLLTAAAIATLFVANFVARGSTPTSADEALASRIEADLTTLEHHGIDRARVRRVARDAFELGRRQPPRR